MNIISTIHLCMNTFGPLLLSAGFANTPAPVFPCNSVLNVFAASWKTLLNSTSSLEDTFSKPSKIVRLWCSVRTINNIAVKRRTDITFKDSIQLQLLSLLAVFKSLLFVEK